MPKGPYSSVPGDQNRTITDEERFTSTATTATAGGGAAVPATVAGFILVEVSGVMKKIPYFNV